jgi:F-type H+-transporting ATPase subunit alpha
MKQSQGSPLSVAEQVAIIYAGINGLVDEIPVNQIKIFSASLLTYLDNSKPEYSKSVSSSGKFDTDAENILKMAIDSVKETL